MYKYKQSYSYNIHHVLQKLLRSISEKQTDVKNY